MQSEQLEYRKELHPLSKIKTQEIEFEGEKYVIRRLKHGELIDAGDEARKWVKEEPALALGSAMNYCLMSRAMVFPRFTPQELRQGDAVIVTYLNNRMNELCFLLLKDGKLPTSLDVSS